MVRSRQRRLGCEPRQINSFAERRWPEERRKFSAPCDLGERRAIESSGAKRDSGLSVTLDFARSFFPQAAAFAKWQVPDGRTEKGGRISRLFDVTIELLADFSRMNENSGGMR
jgi:hypothetical protein